MIGDWIMTFAWMHSESFGLKSGSLIIQFKKINLNQSETKKLN